MATGLSPSGGEHARMLVARYFLLNLIGVVGLAFAWQIGLIQVIYTVDTSRITIGTFIIFLYGNVLCGWHLVKVGLELDRVRNTGDCRRLTRYRAVLRSTDDPDAVRDALAERMSSRTTYLPKLCSMLANIGLFGTVYGLTYAMLGAGIALEHTSSGNFEQLKAILGPALEGVGIALTTTLVGLALNEWLEWTVQVLDTGTRTLYARIIELGAEKSPNSS
ncbi:MAG: hypothetical protein Q7S95_01505 [bacterium]|nr:hypothetical protein [bacterium]